MKCDKRNLQTTLRSSSLILLGLLILPAFAADTSSTGDNTKNVIINLTAKDYAFNVSTITVPAGADVTINFDNMDQGVEHNFAIYETAEAKKSISLGMRLPGLTKSHTTSKLRSRQARISLDAMITLIK